MTAMSDTSNTPATALPGWAKDLITLYESGSSNQFILYGNVNDRLMLPLGANSELGTLADFLFRVLMPRFDVVLSYDLGNGIHVDQGGTIFTQWPSFQDTQSLPKAPRAAVETLTQYFRYSANMSRLGRARYQIGCVIKSADLVTPNPAGGWSYDLNAMAMLMRDWGTDSLLAEHSLATFLITENLNDLHPLLVNNTRVARIKLSLPAPEELCGAISALAPRFPTALQAFKDQPEVVGQQLAGATLNAIVTLLKTKEHTRQPIVQDDLAKLKKELVEGDCNGLIEFIDSKRTLDNLYGQEKVKAWLRQDLALWQKGDLQAMPMGYLLCGPVGTGKTFLIECLAGEAGVPVVKLKNFRDKWIGSTEGNLEKIFRLLHALGKCFVFIDEADQTLGKRDGGDSDSGVGGRIYSMMAEEMSDTNNRGKIIWVLASSRPDLIEVNLKRPGRVDVKIPIFPTMDKAEGFRLLHALCHNRGVELGEEPDETIAPIIPTLLTPGAAEALAVKVYRMVRTQNCSPTDALRACLSDYQNPVPSEVMSFQIEPGRPRSQRPGIRPPRVPPEVPGSGDERAAGTRCPAGQRSTSCESPFEVSYTADVE